MAVEINSWGILLRKESPVKAHEPSAKYRLTIDKLSTDRLKRPRVANISVETRQALDQYSTNSRPALGRYSVDSRPT